MSGGFVFDGEIYTFIVKSFHRVWGGNIESD